MRPVVAVASIAACVLVSGSATAASNVVFRAFGTATLDGVMTPGEWDAAGHADFTVNRASSEGGGTVPATIYVMNDAANLYIGLKVMNATVGTSELGLQFGSSTQEGSAYLAVDRWGAFVDMFTHQIASGTWQAVRDVDYGGTTDGDEGERDASGYSFYELSHPLDDADNAHDFSLRVPLRVAFNLRFIHCSVTCAAVSRFPGPGSRNQEDIVVVSGSRVPPETQLTATPKRLINSPSTEFGFTGTDDVLAPGDLTFECKADDESWRACTSPDPVQVDDGPHTFSVRATDEMLNVDPSPAEWTWTSDSTGPTKPVIRRPRSARNGSLILRFSATDQFTPASGIRFRCAADSTRLHSCPAVYRPKLRPGRHVIRAVAIDRLGNQSQVATFRVAVKGARR